MYASRFLFDIYPFPWSQDRTARLSTCRHSRPESRESVTEPKYFRHSDPYQANSASFGRQKHTWALLVPGFRKPTGGHRVQGKEWMESKS